jgi:hypothetical protein
MGIISTAPLSIAIASGSAAKLTLTLASPFAPAFYLRTINITNNPTGQSLIVPGSGPTHPGKVYVYDSAAVFAIHCAQALPPSTVVISYDESSLEVVRLEFTRTLAAASADLSEALVKALQQVLPHPDDNVFADAPRKDGRAHPSAE